MNRLYCFKMYNVIILSSLVVTTITRLVQCCDPPGSLSPPTDGGAASAAADKVRSAQIAAKGLVTNIYPTKLPPSGGGRRGWVEGQTAEVWLQEVYKGAEKVASSLGDQDVYIRNKYALLSIIPIYRLFGSC